MLAIKIAELYEQAHEAAKSNGLGIYKWMMQL
jgi:endonuclease YncB( thermonuclease family)